MPQWKTLLGDKNIPDYREHNFGYLLYYKQRLFGNATNPFHLPTLQLARFTELSKFIHKLYRKLNGIASKLGTVGPLLYVTGQLFFFSVHKCHQSEPGEQAAQQHVISEMQDRKKRIWFQIIFAPCFVSPSSSFSREVENCAPSSEAKGLQRISNIRSTLQNEGKTKHLFYFVFWKQSNCSANIFHVSQEEAVTPCPGWGERASRLNYKC